MSTPPTRDPVCGKEVDPLRARAVGIFGGTTFYFCSAECKARYADPRSNVEPPAVERRVPEPPPAKPAPPKPAPRVDRVRMEPPRVEAAKVERHAETEKVTALAHPKRRSSFLTVGILAAGAVSIVLLLRGRSEPPAVEPAPKVAAKPVTTPVVTPQPVTPPPVAEKPPQTHEGLVPPLKLGLRRFVDRDSGAPVVSLRLLVIDVNDDQYLVDVVKAPGADDEVDRSDAITPAPEFVASSAKPGTLFSTQLVDKAHTTDVRIERKADAVVAETRIGDAPWHTEVRLPLAEDAQLRAAPFSRKRYAQQETP